MSQPRRASARLAARTALAATSTTTPPVSPTPSTPSAASSEQGGAQRVARRGRRAAATVQAPAGASPCAPRPARSVYDPKPMVTGVPTAPASDDSTTSSYRPAVSVASDRRAKRKKTHIGSKLSKRIRMTRADREDTAPPPSPSARLPLQCFSLDSSESCESDSPSGHETQAIHLGSSSDTASDAWTPAMRAWGKRPKETADMEEEEETDEELLPHISLRNMFFRTDVVDDAPLSVKLQRDHLCGWTYKLNKQPRHVERHLVCVEGSSLALRRGAHGADVAECSTSTARVPTYHAPWSLVSTPQPGIYVLCEDPEKMKTARREQQHLRRVYGYSVPRRAAIQTRYIPAYVSMSRKKHYQFRLEQMHPELTKVWDDLRQRARHTQPFAPHEVDTQPAQLVTKLLPFQREGVAWMRRQEQNEFRGGILADEMGMGKTIQTIALLLDRLGEGGQTLIVAPTVALVQWGKEIERHTGGALSVHLFHGPKRTDDANELRACSVVLTTYAVIESSFRKQEHGFRRKTGLIKEPSILHTMAWKRVVLDEAHSIKDRACNTARAVFALQCEYRWSLTGTPLQNRVGELYSLIRFMRVDPYSYYFCRQCKCKSLHWRFSDRRQCDDCGHAVMSHLCWWNNEILKPIQGAGASGEGLVSFKKLNLLLDRMMLRRTKIERADDLNLPPRNIAVRRDFFSPPELDFYQSLYTDATRQFSTYVEAGTVLNNYANIFELITRMRQAVNHPDLLRIARARKNAQGVMVCSICHEEAEDPIRAKCKHVFCRADVQQYIESFASGTPTCPVCYHQLTVDLTGPACQPESNVAADRTRRATTIVNELDMSTWRSSTKIEALVEELDRLRQEGYEQGCVYKSLVFSQYVSFLDLVHWRLGRGGWKVARLDGRMGPAQRDKVIQAFTNDPDITVFLISLKAGGIALNLTAASHVFIADPWWNPSVESQAMDRIHRLGQCRPIQVKRLIVEDSIESRILQLQEKKQALFNSTIGRDAAALARLSEADLEFLFAM